MEASGFGPVRGGFAGSRASPYDRPAPVQDPNEPCQFFTKAGWCKFGDTCKYAHVGEAKPQEICQFFVKTNWCKWGDKCKHLHVASGPLPTGALTAEEQLLMDQPLQTGAAGEACQFFTKAGWCKFGDRCRYAHHGAARAPPSHLAPLLAPHTAAAPQAAGAGEQCQFFAKSGWCKFGENCRFMHSLGGGAPPLIPPASHHGGTPRGPVGGLGGLGEVCEFFAKAGWCKFGDGCKYMHAGNVASVPPARAAIAPNGGTKACKFFSSPAGCRNGAACPFEHAGAPGAAAGANHIAPGALTPGGQVHGTPGEVCEFFLKAGWCKWGDQCKYVHQAGIAIPEATK